VTNLIIDASVAVKWLLKEKDSQAAIRLLDGKHYLLAPDLIRAEFANVIWKQQLHGALSKSESMEILRQFLRAPLEILASDMILEEALSLAIQTRRTVYDCTYLALAVHKECKMVTADERLVNSLQQSRWAENIYLLGLD